MVEDIGDEFEEEGEEEEEEEELAATLEIFTEFFKEFEDEKGKKKYFEAIKRLSLEDKRSLEIDFMDLMSYDSELADQILENSDNYIPYAKAAIKELVKIEDPSHAERVKEFHARFFNSAEHINLRALRAIHLGKLISIDGILTRVTIVKPLLTEGAFKCGFCGEEVYIEQERGRFTKPSKCPNPTCLKSGAFKLLQEESKYIDWQKITLQERPEELPPGQIPRSIDAILIDDIVDIARPGDRITVTGVIRATPDFTRRGVKLATFHTYLDLLNLKTFGKEYEEFEISPEEEEQIKELARDPFIHQKITKSIAPSIYGYETIKEAVAFLLFGGIPKVLPDGIKIRGESNLLLIGDPGVAKCVAPGSRVIMGSGEVKNIEQIVEDTLKDNINEIDDGFYAKGSQPIITMDKNGKAKLAYANIFWKRKAPEYMYEVKTSSGKEIIVTPTHPFFITKNGLILSKEAKELEIGDFIATPRYIPSSPNDKIDIKFEKGKTNAKHIYVPRNVTKELARFLGYICGDGCVQRTKTSVCTWFTNNEKQILTDYINSAKDTFVNINYTIRPNRPRKSARDIYISSIELGRFLEHISPSFYKGAENKQVPSIIMRSPNEIISEFLKAYYDTDGYVGKNRATISVSSSSKRLLSDIQLLLNRFGIISQLGYSHSRSQSSDKKRYNRLKITSIDQFNRFKEEIGLNSSKKEKLNKNLSPNTNIDIIPGLKDLLLELRKERNLTQAQIRLARSTYQHYERGDRNPSRTNLKIIIKELKKYGDCDKLNQLRTIANTDVFWDKIISIQKIKPDFEWVYDLQVPETHNFIANSIYVHNSQLLKYVSSTAPRALYTSGKGSTAAGLCVAPDTLVEVDGEIREIEGVVESEFTGGCEVVGKDVLKSTNGRIRNTNAIAIHNDLRIHSYPISKGGYWKLKAPRELVEITVQSGKQIVVTPETRLLTQDDEGFEWVKASDLNEDHHVATTRSLPSPPPKLHYFTELLSDPDLIIRNGGALFKEIINKLKEKYGTVRNIAKKYGINEDKMYHFWPKEKHGIPANLFITLCKDADIPLQILRDSVELSFKHTTQTFPIRYLEDPNFLRFVGMTAADGNIDGERSIRFFNTDPILLKEFKTLVKTLFSVKVEENINKEVPYLRFHSKLIAHLLSKLGIPPGEKSSKIDIPPEITKLPNNALAAYISGLFDCDGGVVERIKGSSSIQFSTTSKLLAKKLHILLLRFGIHAILRKREPSKISYIRSKSVTPRKKRYVLTIYTKQNLLKFEENIGFKTPQKARKLRRIIKKISKIDTNTDLVPNIGKNLRKARHELKLTAKQLYGYKGGTAFEKKSRNISRNHLNQILNKLKAKANPHPTQTVKKIEKIATSDIYWEKIKKIQTIKDSYEYVYDLTVKNYHNFIANGIIVHNTAAVLKDSDTGDFILEAGALVLADRGVACLHEDSKVLIDNRIVNIGSLFDEQRKFKSRSGNEEVEICELNANIISIDSRLKTAPSRSLLIRRKKYKGEMLEITLSSGFKVKVTPDHKLLDGNTLEWRDAGKFKKGDFVVAPLKLPENKENVYFLDIIPDNWLVILGKKEKIELKEKVLASYKSLSEFNRKYNISRDFLSGRSQIKLGKLRKILKDLGWHEEWRNKYLKYGRKSSGEMLKVSKITPELAYFLGFAYGDGDVNISSRRSRISITQSLKNRKQIELVKKMFHSFSQRKLGEYRRKTESLIRGQKVESENVILYANSNLLAYVYSCLVGEGLKNLLKLPDEALKAFIAGCLDSDGCISVKRGRKSDKIYETVHVDFQLSKNEEENKAFMLALRRFDCFAKLRRGKGVNNILITGREDVSQLLNAIKKYSVKIKTIPTRKHLVSSLSDKLPNTPVAKISTQIISSINKSTLLKKGIWSTLYAYKNKRYQPSRQQLLKIKNETFDFLDEKLRSQIELLTCRDYFLDKIVEIKKEKYSGYVYDLYIPKYHNFLCDGIIVHNCIDEFDKMEATDRVAIHEAMEQHTISIAKAGIVATLNARTSILAAANPAFGRYDAYRTPAENIKLPVTILSRFDLIFVMTDVPESAADRALAAHILKLHQTPEEAAEPPITQDLLRKYISYSRKTIHPILSEESVKRFEDYYVQIRSFSESKKTPIAITARQLESLIRLAESRARMALRDVVTLEDAEASIQLVQCSLQQVGIDQETGMIDIDTIMTGKPLSIRTKMEKIIDILSDLEEEYGKEVPIQKLQEEVINQGIDEKSFAHIMKQLRDEGMLYEPKTGFVGRVGS